MEPATTAPYAAQLLKVTQPAARNILERLTDLGILKVFGGAYTRPRVYIASELLHEIERPLIDESGEQLPLLP